VILTVNIHWNTPPLIIARRVVTAINRLPIPVDLTDSFQFIRPNSSTEVVLILGVGKTCVDTFDCLVRQSCCVFAPPVTLLCTLLDTA